MVISMRRFFALTSLIWFAASCAQLSWSKPIAPIFSQYTVNDGLAHISLADATQDKDGFLWLATQAGIDRFDGYSFRNFGLIEGESNSGLQSITALQVEASPDGKFIWVGTFGGLSRLNVDTEKFTHFTLPASEAINNAIINRIKNTADNTTWIISDRNLYKYSDDLGEVLLVAYLPNPTSTLTDVELVDDVLYVTSTSGLYKLDSLNKKLQLVALEKQNLTRIVATEDERIWIATTNHGACIFNPLNREYDLSEHCITTEQGLSDDYVTDILVQNNGDVWVATERGLNLLPSYSPISVITTPVTARSTKDERFSALFETSEGLVIAAMKDDGFAVSDPILANFYSTEVGGGRIVTSVSSNNDSVWLVNEKGLWNYDYNNDLSKGPYLVNSTDSTTSNANEKMLAVHYDSVRNDVWVATRSGLSKFNPDTKNLNPVALEGKSGYSLNVDSDGDVWYGGYSDGVFVYRPSDDKVVRQWPLPLTTRVLHEQDGNAWLTTVGGLYFANKSSGELINVGDFSPMLTDVSVITWISKSSRGGYWLATQANGFYFMTISEQDFSTLQLTRIKPDSVITGLSIGAIVEDEQNGLWITTDKGIAHLASDLQTLSFYGSESGAIDTGYYIGAATQTRDNTIILGGAKGITRFNPSDVQDKPWSPLIHITRMEVISNNQTNGSEMRSINQVGDRIELYPEDISFTLAFSALDFINADTLRYAYRLSDFESGWRYTDSKSKLATYTNLDPGRYRFTVKAINKENKWSSNEAQIEIVIIPPWWDMPIWRALILLTIVALISTMLWLRFRTLQLRSQELSVLVDKRTEDLNRAVEKLTLLSTEDALTGLKNRRYFSQRATEAWNQYFRYKHTFSLILIDIDLFKTINDTHGHGVGDTVLIDVAKILTENVRVNDIVARWGGEEFLILLPALNVQEAYWVADKLRKKVAEHPIKVQGKQVPVSITCGVAEIKHYESVEACIQAVDKKLYEGKALGRNTVVN